MELTKEQVARFHKEGYLFLPETFNLEEVEVMRNASSDIFQSEREEVWREKSGAPRTAFACHKYSKAFEILAHDPRLVNPVKQLLEEEVYIHQFKINAKAAFTGDVWQWHQDFPTWNKDDGMPQPRAMNISVFLDDVLPVNGPLMFLPGSHRHGALQSEHDTNTTAYPLWTLDNEVVTELAKSGGGVAAPTGKAGGLLLHHGNLVHGSSGNITPYPRRIVYLTLSTLSNAITKPTRPEFIAHRDFSPVQCCEEHALVEYARSVKSAA